MFITEKKWNHVCENCGIFCFSKRKYNKLGAFYGWTFFISKWYATNDFYANGKKCLEIMWFTLMLEFYRFFFSVKLQLILIISSFWSRLGQLLSLFFDAFFICVRALTQTCQATSRINFFNQISICSFKNPIIQQPFVGNLIS